MEKKSGGFFSNTALPFAAGIITYLAGRALPLIPKDLSIFTRLGNSGFIAGLIEGLGNVRNMSAAGAGLFAARATQLMLNKNESNNTAHICLDACNIACGKTLSNEGDELRTNDQTNHRIRVAGGKYSENIR